MPVNAPNPTRRGYGQSFGGTDLNNQFGEARVKHDFGENWHLITGVLHQIANRNVNSAVNSFTNSTGSYQTYLANEFSALFPRYQVNSDTGYLTGKFKIGKIGHEVVIGSTGYRFASWSTTSALTKIALCPAGEKTCLPTIADPLQDVEPASGIPSYSASSPQTHGIYVSSILHQQDSTSQIPFRSLRACS